MDDAFTLLRRATDLLSEGARAENGVMVDDVRDYQRHQEWELVLDLLMEIGDEHLVPLRFWSLLADAARQMMLEHSACWCDWRAWELQHGTFRARLSLLSTEEGGRRTAFSGQGQLRPLWDIGNRAPDGGQAVSIARLWVEGVPGLAPGESATVRLAPLSPEQWRHVEPGDVITMHEGRLVVGAAVIIEVAPPSVAEHEGDL
ncbi:hypothetical protein OH738_17520 [Streptomyces hirsutus]|uniref:hypothetical protein n=1 Tax=Streptomyces hirsutus TaxID=35620 RepID=UPI00386EDD25|nr:hypothetical protein OH738_17520 [Streptomyces hirsutus]